MKFEKLVPEQNYDFLKRRRAFVHPANMADPKARAEAGEIQLDDSWRIVLCADMAPLVRRAAEDFQRFLGKSMDLFLGAASAEGTHTIAFKLGEVASSGRGYYPFRVEVSAEKITVTVAEARSALYVMVYLEDELQLRRGPIFKTGTRVISRADRMRSVHSGAGMDDFPDWELDATLHAGFNAIDLFVKEENVTAHGRCVINDLIDRAESYGLDVILYNYLPSFKHPSEPDAEAFFDGIYGNVFRRYPKARGIAVVGESLEFPSKDPHTTGKRHRDSNYFGIPDLRPSPGWYPCEDYPEYLQAIVNAVHKVKPDAEIILNTYNWGWTSAEARDRFLSRIPKELTIQATYDIFRTVKRDGVSMPCMDYSVSADEPGEYFVTEMEAGAKNGFRLRATTNMAGTAWDFGCAPYAPVPQRWAHRMNVVHDFLVRCKLESFYESHHYGWWQNPALDLGKKIFRNGLEPESDDAFLLRVARRDFGEEAAPLVCEAWRKLSAAMEFYPATNEDQYGPWRVGPAYPFVFHPNITRTMARKEIEFPTAKGAHFGYRIVKTFYQPYENSCQSPAQLRFPLELKRLAEMEKLVQQALDLLEKACPLMPDAKRENGERLYVLVKFIRNSTRTVIHIKKWYLLNIRLLNQTEREAMLAILDELLAISAAEKANAADTVECTALDSRLGWEPSMEYVCDPWHLEWKQRQLEAMEREIDQYRKCILL